MEIFGLHGIGEVRPGDDLAALLLAALAAGPAGAGGPGELRDGDVLVVSSKVVSKAEGRVVAADTREAQIDAETVRLVAARRTPRGLARIVQAAAGPVMAAAGVDNSNVAPGTVLLLPKDPDASARGLRARLAELTGTRIGVILSDTAGRAWRDGQVDFALGAAGVAVTEDLRGAVDTHGQPLEVTVRALADELAAAADLVKGKLTAVPAAIVRGCADQVTDGDGPGAAVLLRTAREDWFRYGHVEAVTASLGVDPASLAPPAVPPDSTAARLARAVDVALRAPTPWPAPTPSDRDSPGPSGAGACPLDGGPDPQRASMVIRPTSGDARFGPAAALGALAQRIAVAAWAEDLALDVTLLEGPPPSLHLTATPR